jgi:hypothetical protein
MSLNIEKHIEANKTMLIRKVINAKVIEANKGKLEALEREYANFQKALRGCKNAGQI